ncbi:MAG: hypothetical protein LBH58_11375 [Tannerellaceae bacterium]|jgi:ParB-like chromosome segregation protein Spo0J|nr:hypothetical protein [Tannerellaceae bacterium]
MSEYQNRQRKQVKLSRLEIVAKLYKRGYSMRKIQSEVMTRLELSSYSLQTVHRDIQSLLAEWRKSRLEDIDIAVQLELERIDEIIQECWEQWEKSKQDYTKTASKRKGAPVKDKGTGASALKTIQKEETETEVICMGDVSYLAEIGRQLIERRKLLGLYAPEQKEFKISEYDLSNLTPEQKSILFEIGEQALNEL